MQSSNGYLQATTRAKDDLQAASPVNLQRVVTGQVSLGDALHILAHCQEEHMCLDADLSEREAWVVTSILDRSEVAWELLAKPTLRFVVERPGESVPYHLEVGRYAHLAALLDATAAEQELAASQTLCWARVYPHKGRQEAGATGALARSYIPIMVDEAVATLGMRPIVAAIESAVRAAGSDLRAEAERLNRRREGLVDMERALGWDANLLPLAPGDRAAQFRGWLAQFLLGQTGRSGRLLTAGFASLLIGLLCLLFNPMLLVIALPTIVVGLLIWEHIATG
jgi:hypothetical protein